MSNPIPGRDGIPAEAIVHGACGRWWTGEARSHCGGCCLTFSSLSAFEAHRRGLRCNEPAEVGLVLRMVRFGALWGWPSPEAGRRAQLAAAWRAGGAA